MGKLRFKRRDRFEHAQRRKCYDNQYAKSGKTVIRSKLGGPWYSENVFDGDKKFRRKKGEATGCVFPFLLMCSGALILGGIVVSTLI